MNDPLATAPPLVLRIERLNSYGIGMAFLGGVKHLVPGTLAGEVVEAVSGLKRKDSLYCRLVRVLENSPERAKPLCPHFGVCGGCDLQHVSYAAQLALKTSWVREFFKHQAGTVVEEIVPAPLPYSYRNRVTLHHDGVNFGFHRANSREIEPVKSCAIASNAVNEKLGNLGVEVFSGPASFEIREDEGAAFVQVNTRQNETLVQLTAGAAALKKSWRVLELYAGAGNFSFALAKGCREVIAVESHAGAVAIANRLRKERGVKNISFVRESAHEAVFRMVQDHAVFDVVVCDPPREGLQEAALLLPKLEPRRIVYVSCDPRAFLKDAEALLCRGYRLSRVAPVDMFPQTRHIELVSSFEIIGG